MWPDVYGGSGRRVAEREAAARVSLGSGGVPGGRCASGVFEPEALAGEGDDAGVVEEAVEDGTRVCELTQISVGRRLKAAVHYRRRFNFSSP